MVSVLIYCPGFSLLVNGSTSKLGKICCVALETKKQWLENAYSTLVFDVCNSPSSYDPHENAADMVMPFIMSETGTIDLIIPGRSLSRSLIHRTTQFFFYGFTNVINDFLRKGKQSLKIVGKIIWDKI